MQKGGTTTLHTLLAAHPQLMLPQKKELHFFTHRYWRGKRWYGRQFRDARPDQKCGEITPYYLFHPLVPERIKRCCPKARLIVLLRDPVERALSQYFHSKRFGLEILPLDRALAAEPERLRTADKALKRRQRHKSHQEHSYVSRSRYEFQLQRYEQLFPREQIFIARSEDLFERPEWVWRELLQLLELDLIPLPAVGVRANASEGESREVRDILRSKIYVQLRERLGQTYDSMENQYGLVWNTC